MKRVHILSTVNAGAVSKAGTTYTIRDVCGATDGIVMNRMLYPGDQLAAGAASLEGKPAPAGHPKDSEGRFISATNGAALLSAYAGAVCRNARHEGGRTVVDIVVNEAQAKAHPDGAKLIERLDAAINGTNTEPIHVSTGLMCEPVTANGESGGKAYDRVATRIDYDHLAFLLNERGAGTPEQGVGMFLNAAGQEEKVEVGVLNAEDVDKAKAEKSLKAAIALHEKHMNGTAPTTGEDGEKSQMKMMRMMKAALEFLTGKGDGEVSNGKNKPKAKGMGGMKMNADNEPADHRSDGFMKWLHKRLSNSSELSFDQITDGLRALIPDDAWLREVFDRYAIWTDRDGKYWKQDYSVSSDGSVSFSGTAEEVTRRVEYETVNSQEGDTVKDTILAALNAAGIATAGLTDAQLLAAYNAHVEKPHKDALAATNSKLTALELAANAAAEAELTTLATELAVNTSLKPEDFKAMGLERCKELKAANAKAAPVLPGSGAPGLKAAYNTLPE